ncbi:cytochrome P450 [Russula brevipes]|nr:cytochrome P450 [Russula brevipes]
MSRMFAAHIPKGPEMRDLVSNYIPPIYSSIATAIVLSGVLLLYIIVNNVRAHFTAPTRVLPGPKSVSWLTGSHASDVWEPDALDTRLEWIQQYGPVFKYCSLFNMTRVITTDPQALNHVFHAPEFEKTPEGRTLLGDILGRGLLFVEGPKHKQQSPAFGLPQVKEYSLVFVEKANELRDALKTQISQSGAPNGSLAVDIYLWMNKVTLDIIGHAGFNHAFNSLHQEGPHEMTEGFRKSTTFDPFSFKFMIPALIPPARLIPTDRSRSISKTLKSIRAIGRGMIAQKKAEIHATSESDAKGGVEKRNIKGHTARMTDDEILAQIPTFMLAGHETTSTAVSWGLYALASCPAAYTKLTVEARAFYTDTPSMDELSGMTYLDYVTKEVLRLHAPVSNTDRVAKEDTVVPLSQPFVDRYGVKRREFRLKSLWGDDADEFKPEPKAIPGVYSNLLAFIAGTHACIGYRFSVIEMKAILFSFVRSFDFELAIPPSQITRKTMIVARPFVASELERGPQLPLIIRPAKSD